MAGKRPVSIVEMDFGFRHGIDVEAFTAAIEPPEDVAVQASRHSHVERLPLWQRHLLAWGWSGGANTSTVMDQPYALGGYGDWTWLEDDERLMPLLAPYVEPNSRIVFTLATLPLHGNPQYDFEDGPFEAWEFSDGKVTRRSVDKQVEYL